MPPIVRPALTFQSSSFASRRRSPRFSPFDEPLSADPLFEAFGHYRARANENPTPEQGFPRERLMGFEPTTFCMASRRSSQLSYSRAGHDSSFAMRFPALGASHPVGRRWRLGFLTAIYCQLRPLHRPIKGGKPRAGEAFPPLHRLRPAASPPSSRRSPPSHRPAGGTASQSSRPAQRCRPDRLRSQGGARLELRPESAQSVEVHSKDGGRELRLVYWLLLWRR